jgi:hypothetical protein
MSNTTTDIEEVKERVITEEDYKTFCELLLAEPHSFKDTELPDNATFQRFHIARNYKHATSAALYANYHQFYYVDVKPEEIKTQQVITSLSSGKNFQYGVDKHGRPTGYTRGSLHDKHIPLEETRLFIYYEMVKVCKLLTPEIPQFAYIIDVTGFGFANFDVAAVKLIFESLDHYYPERLGCVYIVNAGAVFKTLWNMVKGFIPERTRGKISLSSGNGLEKLLQNWDKDQLLKLVGGDNPYEFDHTAETSTALADQLLADDDDDDMD